MDRDDKTSTEQLLNQSDSLETSRQQTTNPGMQQMSSAQDLAEQNIAKAPGENEVDNNQNVVKRHKFLEFMSRFWRKFNIYLWLFVAMFLVLMAVVIVLVVTNKSNSGTTKVITSQALSDDALKQIAASNVNVGTSNQVLNVQSSAVFAASVLMRGNLEVGGQLKLGGDLSINNLTVPGATHVGVLQANSLSTSGNGDFLGVITGKNGLNVSGNGSFSGSLVAAQMSATTLQVTNLQLNGDIRLSQHIVTNGSATNATKSGAIGNGGTVSVSGNDTSGNININTGTGTATGCVATVTFAKAFSKAPQVLITPTTAAAAQMQYYVTRTAAGFNVCAADTPAASQTLGYTYWAVE